MSMIRRLAAFLLLILLGIVGYWLGVLSLSTVLFVSYQRGDMPMEVLGNPTVQALMQCFFVVCGAAFAWFFAGRRYWKHWQQARVTSASD